MRLGQLDANAVDDEMTRAQPTDLPIMTFPDVSGLRTWLTENHLTSTGAWVGGGLLEGVDVVICDDFSIEAGMAAATTALTSGARPSAIATVADELAIGVIDAARRVGVRIPDELALVSYGAIDTGAYVDPPITTILLPTEEMGLLAARRLAARIRGEPPAGTTFLPGRIVVRKSCGHHDD